MPSPHQAAAARGRANRYTRGNGRSRISGALKGAGKGRGHGGQRQQDWAGEPLTLPKAKRQSHAEAGLRFDPLLRNIRAEMRASHQREQDIGNWYGQLQQTMAQGEQQSAAAAAAARAGLQKQLETAQAGSQANQAAIAGQNADFAKLVGANPAAFAPSANQAAAAASQRDLAQVALSTPIIASGANQAAFLAAQKGNAGRDSIYQRLQESKRGRKMLQDFRSVQGEKGLAQVENLGKLREGERNYHVQQEAFGQKGKQFAAEQGLERQKLGQAASENAFDRSYKEQKLRNEGRKIGHEGKGGGLTPFQRHEQQRGQKSANVTARSLYAAAKHKPETPAQWSAFVILVAKEAEGADQVAAKKAVEKLRRRVQRRTGGIKAIKKAVTGF